VEENPSRGHHLASSMSNLVGMYDSPDKPSFGTEMLADVVADELAGHHFKSMAPRRSRGTVQTIHTS